MSNSGERERVDRIRALLHRDGEDLEVAIGDDAAVLAPRGGSSVLSVDVQVEGVHFRRDWLSFEELGGRAYHAAASDLAAMGADPRAALISLILTPDITDQDLDALVGGIGAASDAIGAPVIGGNLARGGELSVTTTVLGSIGVERLERSGARPGDAIYVTGTVGGAALGVAALQVERGDDPRFLPYIERYRSPRARIGYGKELAGHATAAADVSDGLVADLAQICRASAVGALLWAEQVPTDAGLALAAGELRADPVRLALAGGEDFELVFTAKESERYQAIATQIGEITAGPEIVCLGPDGAPLDDEFAGFDHF